MVNFRQYDFCDRFFRLSAFNILSNLMVPLAGLIDIAFLGHLAELRHLAGVALATVLFNYIYWTFGFLRMGTTGTTAQAVGRGDQAEVVLTGLRYGAIALSVGLLILLLQTPLRTLGFWFLSAAPEVERAGQAYYDALIWGAPATLINFVLMGWFLGRGQGSPVLILSGVGNGVNVALNYGFIVRLGWESAGAGAATALSQYAMLAVGMGLLLGDGRRGQWDAILGQGRSLLPQVLDPTALKSAFLLNGNIVIRTFAFLSIFALFTNLSAAMGTVVLAANTLLLQALSLAAYFVDGLAFATESYAGLFRGRGNGEKLVALVTLSAIASVIVGVAIALLFVVFSVPLFSLLTRHTEVVEQVQRYVGWLLPVLLFASQAYMLDGYFLGLTEGAILRRAAVMAAVVGFGPVGAIAWALRSPHLLWLAMLLFMVARALTLALQLPHSFRDRRHPSASLYEEP